MTAALALDPAALDGATMTPRLNASREFQRQGALPDAALDRWRRIEPASDAEAAEPAYSPGIGGSARRRISQLADAVGEALDRQKAADQAEAAARAAAAELPRLRQKLGPVAAACLASGDKTALLKLQQGLAEAEVAAAAVDSLTQASADAKERARRAFAQLRHESRSAVLCAKALAAQAFVRAADQLAAALGALTAADELLGTADDGVHVLVRDIVVPAPPGVDARAARVEDHSSGQRLLAEQHQRRFDAHAAALHAMKTGLHAAAGLPPAKLLG